MKELLIFLGCVFASQLFFAQTKDQPSCKTIKTELTTINNSFDSIVEKFKSKEDKISLVKTYFSDFSICGEKGKIKDYGRKVEFAFKFTDADYKGGKEQFNALFEKILKELTGVFGMINYYKLSGQSEGKSRIFYELGKDISTSKRVIRLLLSYKDPVDDTETYSVSLTFEYYPKR
jgi:hypothetical protein